MARLISAVLLIALTTPTLAAGWDGMPLEFSLAFYLVLGLFLAVPATGLGFVLGSFLKLQKSVLVLAILAAIPIAFVGINRGIERAAECTATLLILMLVFFSLDLLGLSFGPQRCGTTHEL